MNNVNAKKVRAFLASYFDPADISDQDDFVAQGLVSSLLLIELIGFVRREFLIDLPVKEIDLRDFRTIGAICALIQRKQGDASSVRP